MAVALIVAAGSGERLGAGRAKALVGLGGKPLLQWSIDALAAVGAIERIVVALPGPDVQGLPEGVQAPAGTRAVAGGPTRSQSVLLALAAAGAGDPVLIHDAARPFLTPALAEEVLLAAAQEGVDGAVAATPVTDTIKRTADEVPAAVLETLERSSLWSVQTPQAFRRAALERALAAPPETLARATDDAWLVEQGGGRVVVVRAPRENLKVTTALDLAVAELLIERGRSQPA